LKAKRNERGGQTSGNRKNVRGGVLEPAPKLLRHFLKKSIAP
jgi:hypothetical protein